MKKKKQETKEQTTSGSSGAFEAPAGKVIKKKTLYSVIENKKKELGERRIGRDGPSLGDFDMVKPKPFGNYPLTVERLLKLVKLVKAKDSDLGHLLDRTLENFGVLDGSADNVDWKELTKFVFEIVKQAGITIGPDWKPTFNPYLNEGQAYEAGSDGASLGDHPVKAGRHRIPLTMSLLRKLIRDLMTHSPVLSARIDEIFDGFGVNQLQADEVDWNAVARSVIDLCKEQGITIGPDWKAVFNPHLNEELDDFESKLQDMIVPFTHKRFKILVADIEKYIPSAIPELHRLFLKLKTDRKMDWAFAVEVMKGIVEKNGMTIGPDWHVTPAPHLNETEQEMEESTDSGSSGSYETPGCWATGKGKESISNSRAVKSGQFKKARYGGPTAQYVKVKDSVNSVNEGIEFMKDPNVQKCIEETARRYKISEEKIASLLVEQLFIKKRK